MPDLEFGAMQAGVRSCWHESGQTKNIIVANEREIAEGVP
jgi:hypothetical protein